jgi:hypothetical protein
MNTYKIVVLLLVVIIVGLTIYYFLKKNDDKTSSTVVATSVKNPNLASIQATNADFQQSVTKYYIFSAFNCCNTGTISDGYCSTSMLTNVLLNGVRFLDFQIFSQNDQPVVSTSTQSSYYIKEGSNVCPFTSVMQILTTYGFSSANVPNPNDPLFIHLRFFSSNETMFQNLANIFKQYDNLLLDPTYAFQNTNNPLLTTTKLTDLMNYIIICVDATNSSFLDCSDLCEYVNLTSNSMNFRSLSYSDVVNLSDIQELQRFNSTNGNMTMVTPDMTSSDNPNSIVTQEAGIQITCMMFNLTDDTNLDAYTSVFNKAGTAFVLEPTDLSTMPSATIPDAPQQSPAVSFAPLSVTDPNYSYTL